jgi:group I intron endonuclease
VTVRFPGIYCITNLVNGKCYIGSAVSIRRRWDLHLSDLRNNRHHSPILQKSFNKHGEKSFCIEVLARCSKSDLIYFEQKCLDLLKPEYNICKTAGSCLGSKQSEETKEKRAQKHRGQKRSEETKRKISEALKGKSFFASEEHREKFFTAGLNTRGHLGHKHSEETKQLISKQFKGKPWTQARRDACNKVSK